MRLFARLFLAILALCWVASWPVHAQPQFGLMHCCVASPPPSAGGSGGGCTLLAETQTLLASPAGAPTYTFDTTGLAAGDYVLFYMQNVSGGVVEKFSDGTPLAQLDDEVDGSQHYVIYGGVLNSTNLAAGTVAASGTAMTATEPVIISTWRGAGTATKKGWNFNSTGGGTDLVLTGFAPSTPSCGVVMVGNDENSLSAGTTIAGSPGTWTPIINGTSTPTQTFFTNYLFLNTAYANAPTTFQTYEVTATQGAFLVEFTP